MQYHLYKKWRFLTRNLCLVAGFIGLAAFSSPTWGVNSYTIQIDGIPEFRAVDASTDAVIRSDADWNYLGLISYQSSNPGTTFEVSGLSVLRTNESSVTFDATNTTFTWDTAAKGVWDNNAGVLPAEGNAIRNMFIGSREGNGNATTSMTISNLQPDTYYTLQLFTSTSAWNSAYRNAYFTFNSGASDTPDQYYFYPDNTQSGQLVSTTRLYQDRLSEHITGVSVPMSLEYSFKTGSDATAFTINIQSPDATAAWHVSGVAMAQRASSPITHDYTMYGDLVNDNGVITACAYATLDGMPQLNVPWTLEVAASKDGERAVVISGTSPLGGENSMVTIQGNILASLNLDPSFEAAGAGKDSAWTVVLDGDGKGAYYNNTDRWLTDSGIIPANGLYYAYPGQTLWNPGNSTTAGRDGVAGEPGLIRSGKFDLTGDAISFQLLGGSGANTDVNLLNGENGISNFMGVGIWDVDKGEYVAFKTRSGNASAWETVMFTAEEIAALMAAGTTTVTLDLIDDYASGAWGFQTADNFQMLGDLLAGKDLYYFLSIDGYEIASLGPMSDNAVPEPATWLLCLLGLAVLRMVRSKPLAYSVFKK